MPENISPMFGIFDLCAVEENKRKNFSKISQNAPCQDL